MEIVYFTLVAIGLYALADAALRRLERLRGAPFENLKVWLRAAPRSAASQSWEAPVRPPR